MLIIILFSSCENNDKENISFSDNDTMFVGKWELISLTGGFAANEIFNDKKIMWEFYSNDSVRITIDTVLFEKSRLPFKTDSILFYTYDSINISVGDYKFEYTLHDKSLKLFDNLASDGFVLEFEGK